MKLIHKFRTEAEEAAILNTVEMLCIIRPEQFEMHTALEDSDEMQPATKCNTYGCIAGHCCIANLGVGILHDGDYQGAEQKAAELMGLDPKQKSDLFFPNTIDADHNSINPKDPRQITHRRGILALWYFAKIGVVQWNNERLEKFVAKHPLPKTGGLAA